MLWVGCGTAPRFVLLATYDSDEGLAASHLLL